MLTTRERTAALLSVVTVLGMTFGVGLGQDAAAPAAPAAPAAAPDAPAAAPAAPQTLQSLWEDFLHFIKIANVKAAEANGQAIIARNPPPAEIYKLSRMSPDSLDVIVRGTRLAEIKAVCEQMRDLIEKGYIAMRKDPKEIEDAITQLGGTTRQYERALKRLIESGEYALPQLIQKVQSPDTLELLRARILLALPRMGTQIVRGLSVVLTAQDATVVQVVANVLAKLEHPLAVPRLKELTERKGLVGLASQAARAALIVCGTKEAEGKTVAETFYNQALKYYYRAESLRPDERFPHANVWYWRKTIGLVYKPVPWQIFCDIYAMRMCRLALKHNPDYYPAVSLWLSAYIQKEKLVPAGATDPVRGASQPAAKYYALASPAVYLQHVLARALRDKNRWVAVNAIQALGDTAGADNLVKEVQGGAMPLVQAMTYEDRRVRYPAAEVLAKAKPVKTFAGAEVVLWVLNEAIRQTGKKRVLLSVADEDHRNTLKDAFRAAGCNVLDEPDPIRALAAARALGGVDYVVLATRPAPVRVLGLMRSEASFLSIPVLVAAVGRTYRDLAARDKKTVLINPRLATPEEARKALADADKLGGAPLTPDEAAAWAQRSAKVIRLLGTTGNKVFRIERAEATLIEALGDDRAPVQIASAQALAVMPSADAQRVIVKLATTGSSDEAVRIPAFKAATESVRTFGRKTTDELDEAVKAVVMGTGSADVKNAAAQLWGAMNLPSHKIKEFITSTEGMD